MMKSKNHIISLIKISLLVTIWGIMSSSCDGILDDNYGDCSAKYIVKFNYDYNLKYANAFGNEVSKISLYIFDENDKFVKEIDDSGDALDNNDYYLPIDIEPGMYDLIAFGEGNGEKSYTTTELKPGISTKEDFICSLKRKHSVNGSAYIDEDLNHVYYASKNNEIFINRTGTHIITLPMIKDTNSIRIALNSLEGEILDIDDFSFIITDKNGMINYNNEILDDEEITYYAWNLFTADASRSSQKLQSRATGATALAEFTTGRLMAKSKPILSIYDKTGNVVLSIPLIDYSLMIKAFYDPNMDDQEYLDRQDRYNLTFFIKGGKWINSSVVINGWTVVLNNSNL